MKLEGNRRDRAIALFAPNQDGVSKWVSVADFKKADLGWSNNGNLRRGAAFGITDIKWEARRKSHSRSEITGLRMIGWNTDDAFDQMILPDVRDVFQYEKYCNISMLPVPLPDREVDHRFGNKDHPDYVKLYSRANQQVEDFQLVHRVLNLQKRQMCVKCVEEESRPAHPTLGYAEGDSSLAKRFPCKGCYLAEPERFRGIS